MFFFSSTFSNQLKESTKGLLSILSRLHEIRNAPLKKYSELYDYQEGSENEISVTVNTQDDYS